MTRYIEPADWDAVARRPMVFYANLNGEKPRWGWCGRCLQPNEGSSARTATCSGCHEKPPACTCMDAFRSRLLREEGIR